jgi:hypothetical protein
MLETEIKAPEFELPDQNGKEKQISKLTEETDLSDELILTPSLSDAQSMSTDLVLEAGDIFKAEEITFEGQEEAERRIAEAMSAYDNAMDQAAGNIITNSSTGQDR